MKSPSLAPSLSLSLDSSLYLQSATSIDQLNEMDLQEAEARSRRARIALISTAAMVPVGLILAGIATTKCEDGVLSYDNCTSTGQALGITGAVVFWSGVIGTISSGIVLAVRNGKRRRIKREIRERTIMRGAHWDLQSNSLRF
ncbi:MAG: hypothetical protein R3A47_03660 [Polyangiales bacterium]